MKRIVRSSSPSLFCLRICYLVYVMLAIISTFGSAEINKHNRSKATYTTEGSESIKNSMKLASPHQHGNNKVDGGRNHSASESARLSDEENSAALNRFLEDVLKAQNDLKWIDHATRVNHRARLDDPLAYTNQDFTVFVNGEDVLGRADIGYESRLRGKRGFDRNYETTWMLHKKKYGEESARDVPQRVYLDNDMTFKRDADFDALYRSGDTLDRAIYEGGAMADQPLKDWIRKKDLHSPGDWSNSNENLEVTNGDGTRLRDYEPTREIPDSNEDGKLHVDADARDRSEVASLYDPIYANDFIALREFPSAIRNGKSQNTPLSLESLRKTVLELRKSLMLSNEMGNRISRGGESNWREGPRSTDEIFDLERNLADHPSEETMWRIKRSKNIGGEDESDSRIFQGVEFGRSYLGERDSEKSHDRAKRSRSFLMDLNYTNNQTDIPGDKGQQGTQTIKNILGNVTKIQNIEKIAVKLHSIYPDGDEKNLVHASKKMNVSDSQYPEGFFLNDRFVNLTIAPSVANKTNISVLRHSSNAESYLSNHSIDNKSLFLIKIDPQTHSPKHVVTSKVPKTSLKEISQRSTVAAISKSLDYVTEDHINSPDLEKSLFASNATAEPIRLSTNDGTDDSRKSAEDRSGEKKLVVARKLSRRFGTDDGQSKGAGEDFPRGNTSHGYDDATNESRSRVVGTNTAARRGDVETNGTRKENREPIPGVIKVFMPGGRPDQKQEAEEATVAAARLSWRIEENGTSMEKMRTNDVDVESRNANAREDFATLPIDLVTDATAKPEAASTKMFTTGESIIPRDRHREKLAPTTVDNDSRKQQQMVPPLSAENRNANKSDGNSGTNGIDIRALGSNGNEIMNVKEGTRTIMEAREYRESDNNLRRKLLWIPDLETENLSMKNTRSIFNTATESHVENIIDEDRQQSKIITTDPARKILSRVKRDNNAKETSILQNALNSQISETNRYARYKRSTYPVENHESSNEANPENVAAEKKMAINHDEENNEEYLSQNVEELKGNYDREEDILEDNDKATENEREERSSPKRIDPIKAKVDMMIKQKLEKKNKDYSSDYRRKRRSMLDMIEYYDYDDNEEQEHDAPINEQEARDKDDKISIKDKAKIKRDGKTTCKPGDLGKKKNENAEAVMKEQREKTRAKNKEPKEEIVIDLGERKNKTAKSDKNDKKPSDLSTTSLEDAFNGEGRLSTKENSEKTRESEGFETNVYHEKPVNVKSEWLNQISENKVMSPKNSDSALEDNHKKKVGLDEPFEYISNARVDVNPDAIESILLDFQPTKILEQSRELEVPKNFYEDFGNERYNCLKSLEIIIDSNYETMYIQN